MWKTLCLFELQYQLRRPLFALSCGIFFALGLGLGASDLGTAIGESPGTTLRNAPILLARLTPVLSLLSLFVITVFVAGAALRDFEQRCEMLFFTKPITKLDYLWGRFLGALGTSSLVLLAAILGLAAAPWAPWQDPSRLGPFRLGPYVFGFGVVLLPNLLIMGGLFFALAIRSRRWTLTYLCVVFFIGMQDAVEVLAQSLNMRSVGAILDPSGVVALDTVARYWTVAEQNTRMPEPTGLLLANRLVWLGIAALLVFLTMRGFQPAAAERKGRKGHRARSAPQPVTVEPATSAWLPAPAERRFTRWGDWTNLLRQTRLELSEVVAGLPFLVLLAFGLIFVGAYSAVAGSHQGLAGYPLTHLMVQTIAMGCRLTLVLILVLYAGELMTNRRTLKLSQVYDALPPANWIFLAAKTLALMAVMVIFLAASLLLTLMVQLAKGGVSIDPVLYLKGLGIIAWPLALLIVLALTLQALAGRKLLGLLWTAGFLVLRFALPRLGLEDGLYLYGSHPQVTYSVLNGYGHHLEPFIAHMVYGSFGALILWTVALLFWPRGIDRPWAERLSVARRRWSPAFALTLSFAALGVLISGGWIFYNTHVRHQYLNRAGLIDRLADYEQSYDRYRDLPLPRVTSVYTEVDFYPEERRLKIRGHYTLANPGSDNISLLPVTRSARWEEGVLLSYGGVTLEGLELPEHELLVSDDELGFYLHELARPLVPGDEMELGFEVSVNHSGFSHRRHNNLVVENGSFFSARNFLPTVGYAEGNQVLDPLERDRRDLPTLVRAGDRRDPQARQKNYLNGDWIEFETVVSTSADQVALAPGDLQRQWQENGRAYFQYQTQAPITHLLPFLSGTWHSRGRDLRIGEREINLQVLFDPQLDHNTDHFLDVSERSLEYMTEHFGPYPHDQLKIVQVPSYHGEVAFSFAQIIAYSEAWGFGADLRGDGLDWPAAILAHEVAHQWWNHQLVPADAQGATMIAESLCQYSAMMVLERIYGPQAVAQFLKFHLDLYLQRRGDERVREMPLAKVENQAYVHYSKGSLALYSLKDRVGEEAMNQALASFVDEFRFQGPPYATSLDLLDHFKRRLDDHHHPLLEDLFETITLYDNRVLDADYEPLDDGTFRVRMKVASAKMRDDGQGNLHSLPLDDQVEVAVFGAPVLPDREVDQGSLQNLRRTRNPVLVLEKRRLQGQTEELTFVVPEQPTEVAIDPFYKLLDRQTEDNLRAVTRRSPAVP